MLIMIYDKMNALVGMRYATSKATANSIIYKAHKLGYTTTTQNIKNTISK